MEMYGKVCREYNCREYKLCCFNRNLQEKFVVNRIVVNENVLLYGNVWELCLARNYRPACPNLSGPGPSKSDSTRESLSSSGGSQCALTRREYPAIGIARVQDVFFNWWVMQPCV